MYFSKKFYLIAITIFEILLILILSLKLGYSVAENTPQEQQYNMHNAMEINSEERVEFSSKLRVEKNVVINYIDLYYLAAGEEFEGVLNIRISDGKDEIFYKNYTMEKTDDGYEDKSFSIGINFFKDTEYLITCKIIQQSDDFRIYTIAHDETDTQGKTIILQSQEPSGVAKVGYTELDTIRWRDVFRFVMLLSILVFAYLVAFICGWGPNIKNVVGKCQAFWEKHHSKFFLVFVLVYLGLYEIYYAYNTGVYLSEDSTAYLQEALAILHGYGYNPTGLAGYETWFTIWPIGYPLLIALTAFVSGCNICLSSKILSIILVSLCLLVLHLKFKKDAWIYSLIFFNTGFLSIFIYTWSENPFILALLIFSVSLSEIVERKVPSKLWYILLSSSCVLTFLTRYFGTITVIITFLISAIYFVLYWVEKKYHTREIKEKIIKLIVSGVVASVAVFIYYLCNWKMSGYISGVNRLNFRDDYYGLTLNLFEALQQEIFNATRLNVPQTIKFFSLDYRVIFIWIFGGALAYLFVKQVKKKIDYKIIFIFVGVMYDVVFIIVRYHSSMNYFNYRFFAPASLLISIGVLGFIQQKLGKSKEKLCMLGTLVLMVLSVVLCDEIKNSKEEIAGYALLQQNITNELKDIPEKSVILAFDGDFHSVVIRPDILYVTSQIGTADTMNEVFERYKNSDYICIKFTKAKEIIGNESNYDISVRNFFADVSLLDMDEDSYIIISVAEKNIVYSI